ncbi:MAG TPA: EamA family transporter [Candidatus Nitrosotenuis sp.]|nr:EamA family transporter [Candidatus Nitrosotenuis sp.]
MIKYFIFQIPLIPSARNCKIGAFMKLIHVLIAILVAAIWGFNFVVVKIGLSELPPFMYGAGRFLIALTPIIFFWRKPNVSWKIISGIGFTLGLTKFSLMFLGIYFGMSAGLASLVLQSQVFFTVALSIVIFGSRLQFNQILGMIVAFVGIFMIGWQMQATSSLVGFLCILGSSVAWSISNILYRKAGDVDMFHLTVWTSLIPPIPMLCAAYYFEGQYSLLDCLASLSWVGYICLLFTACASTWIGATLWGVLLKTYDPTHVAPFSLLIPVFGISSAWVVIGEELSLMTLFACSLVFLGLIINQFNVELLPKILFKSEALAEALPANKSLDKAA